MSNVRQGLREFSDGRTQRARFWLVGSVFVIYIAWLWFWSESAAAGLAFAMFVIFALLWIKDGERGSVSDEARR